MAVVEVARNLVGPGATVRLHAVLEHLAQGDHQLPGSFVAGDVRPVDERTEVAHNQVVAGLDGRFGAVAPLGRLHLGNKGLGQGQHSFRARLRPSLFTGSFPFEMQCRTDGGNAATQELLGDSALFGRQSLQHGVAVHVAGAEPALARRRCAVAVRLDI
jgi:hypothetical protein